FKGPNFAPAHCQPPSIREIDLTAARGRSALRPACCPRFRRQQASLRKRRGQLSRESEIFVICVYLFWSGFLRGQRTILDMPPALQTSSRSQYAPKMESLNIIDTPDFTRWTNHSTARPNATPVLRGYHNPAYPVAPRTV